MRPSGRWIISSEPWFLEISRARSIASFALMYGQWLAHFLHLLPAILHQDGVLHVDFFPSQNTSSQSSNASTMRTLTRVSKRNDFFATAANIVFVFDCHFSTFLKIYLITFLEKACVYLPFWTQISYCNRKKNVVQ